MSTKRTPVPKRCMCSATTMCLEHGGLRIVKMRQFAKKKG